MRRRSRTFTTIDLKQFLILLVNVEYDDKNYRTMKVMRRNQRFIVAMLFGQK